MRVVLGALFLFAGIATASFGSGAPDSDRPGLFLMGVWPDRLLFFDEKTEAIVGEFKLRHGAATANAHTRDFRRFYFVTGRMEVVEIVDPAKREVVGEIKLSTEDRKVRFFGVAPDAEGKLLYLNARAVQYQADRFVAEEMQYVVWDVEAGQIKATFELPKEAGQGFGALQVSPDGKELYLMGRDIYVLSAEDYKVVDKLVLSKPLYSGYGPLRGGGAEELDPGVYYGIYRTTDPFYKKNMFGVLRMDVPKRAVDTIELGPEVRVGRLALSPDRKIGYAGLNDLLVIDMGAKQVLKRKENFEQGRTNNSMIVSWDGKKLYIGGVGDTLYIYETANLTQIKTVFAGGDFMVPPVLVPRSAVASAGSGR